MSFSTISINPSVLLGWFQSFYGGKGTGTSQALVTAGGGQAGAAAIKYAPTPPWDVSLRQPSTSQLAQAALGGAQLFNPSAAKLDLPGASADYKKLFALYSGLNSLFAIASEAAAPNVSSLRLSQLQSAFAGGLAQLQTYLGDTSFAKLKLTGGVLGASQTSTATTPQQAIAYDTAALNTSGDSTAVVPAFEGDVQFSATVTVSGNAKTVNFNLADLGSTPRTIGNVVDYLNSQLAAAGAIARFSSDQIPPTPETIQVGGKTATLSNGQQSWALQLNTSPFEQVSLSAPQTGTAVYLGQTVGNQSPTLGPGGATTAPDAQSQLLKFNASGDAVTGPTQPAHAAPGQIFTDALGNSVASVQATAASPDGSVYALANVSTASGGASISSAGQDVALLKYDSAGHLLFQTDLGSAASASGLSLAVSADGSKVAIAGQVTGSLTAGQTVNDPTGANSFVAVYDAQGDQAWRHQTDGLTPNQASGVAFGADGSVYVTGQSQAAAGVQGAQGPSNSYLQVLSATGASVSTTQIATGGVNTSAGVAVDGTSVYVTGTQNGDAVVSEYDVSNPAAPALVASRDLGPLNGGNVAGVAVQNGTVYVAGSARGGALTVGTITSPASGTGLNAFAATLSAGLAPANSDAVAYYGGSGDTRATAVSVANGEVWVAGSATGDLPNEPAIGARDGFIAALEVGSGAVTYANRFTGLDGLVAPTSIAVAPGGESVLDQLGLPQGLVDGPVSNALTANTSVKAGDSFQIAAGGGAPVTITIQAGDTFQSLATRISQALGFTADVTATTTPGGATALEIQPADAADTVRLISGPAGADVLAELGLKPGVVAKTQSRSGVTVLAGAGTPIYGLGLPGSLDLSSAADIQTAKVQLAGALSVVERAYQNLKTAATPAAVLALQKAQSSGKAPAYLTDQIANYQAALNRLTAGQTQTTGLTALF